MATTADTITTKHPRWLGATWHARARVIRELTREHRPPDHASQPIVDHPERHAPYDDCRAARAAVDRWRGRGSPPHLTPSQHTLALAREYHRRIHRARQARRQARAHQEAQ